MTLSTTQMLYPRSLHYIENGGTHLVIDPSRPNWVATNDAQLLARDPVRDDGYQGRSTVLTPTRLEEFWVQINDFCNLSCAHCLVSSSPKGGSGLPRWSGTRSSRRWR